MSVECLSHLGGLHQRRPRPSHAAAQGAHHVEPGQGQSRSDVFQLSLRDELIPVSTSRSADGSIARKKESRRDRSCPVSCAACSTAIWRRPASPSRARMNLYVSVHVMIGRREAELKFRRSSSSATSTISSLSRQTWSSRRAFCGSCMPVSQLNTDSNRG